jgi:thiol-disulfide isomerase/thioredoxin
MMQAFKTICWLGLLLALLVTGGCDRGTRPNLVGERAPDFTVQDSDRTVSLHDVGHGKVVILNFWATWCPPCVEEMPSLVSMQALMKDRVSVLAVNVDYDGDAYHRFLREHNVNLLTVRDPLKDEDTSKLGPTQYGTTVLYATNGYPETYVIDGKGIVRRKFVGAVQWTSPEIVAYLNGL